MICNDSLPISSYKGVASFMPSTHVSLLYVLVLLCCSTKPDDCTCKPQLGLGTLWATTIVDSRTIAHMIVYGDGDDDDNDCYIVNGVGGDSTSVVSCNVTCITVPRHVAARHWAICYRFVHLRGTASCISVF